MLDEPSAGMDVAFRDAMRGQAQTGRTIVFATHYPEEADPYADRVVLLAAGRIVADGPVTERIRSCRATAGGSPCRVPLPSGAFSPCSSWR